MDRYSNKAFEKSLDQANEERRLNANRFDANGNRKLYRYSRNLDDSKCFLPPVPGDERRKRGVFTNYGESGYRPEHAQRSPRCQRQDVWEPTPSNTLKIEQAVPKDWKEERRVRVENAMKRVEQSYVGELRHGLDDTSRYVRPDLNERPEPPRKPQHTLILPTCGGSYPQGEIPDIKITDDQLLEAIDLLIPKKANDPALRKPEDEFLIDMKRQALLERKIRAANEFQRKQRRNGQQPVKEDKPKIVERPPARHVSHLPPPSNEPPMPTTPINGIIVKLPRPVPPIKPKQEESYSKRKRKLKQRAVNGNEDFAPMDPHQPFAPAPPSAANSDTTSGTAPHKPFKKKHGKHKVSPDTNPGAAYRVQNTEQEEIFGNVTPVDFTRTSTSLAYFIPNEPQNDFYDIEPVANVPSTDDSTTTLYGSRSYKKAPIVAPSDTIADDTPEKHSPIPRQASYNIWNSDTAKLGLGFKSKLRKEMEEASLRALEPKEDSLERKPQRPHVTSEVAAKWKREMLKDF